MKSALEIVAYGLKAGDNLITFKNANGTVMASLGMDGVFYPKGVQFPDGSKTTSVASGFPDTLDGGNF